MVYEPLHHKYRPQTFGELVGQAAIATTLANAIRQQRIAPAYLFAGPRGTGKTSSARILAKSLNCLTSEGPSESPCGQCAVCQGIGKDSVLDVIEIDAASNTGVESVRELIEKAQFAPVQCRYKVYILDEIHMLSTAASNALLKTLEEPPERVIFVLATTDPQRVLPTIISRCQRFDFRRIGLEVMVSHLGHIAKQERIPIAPEALGLVAQIAQGGLRDAESLLDQLSLLPEEVTVEMVWDLVGTVPEQDLFALVTAITRNNPEGVLDGVRQLLDRGREPLIVLQNLASFYRDLLIVKTAPERADLVTLSPDIRAQIQTFVQGMAFSTLLQSQEHLRASEGQIKNSTQPRLWLEVTLLGLLPAANRAESSPITPTATSGSTEKGDQRPVPGIQNQTLRSQVPATPAPATAPPSSTTYRDQPPVPRIQNQTPGPESPAIPAPATAPSSPVPRDLPPPDPTPSEPDLDQLWLEVLGKITQPSTRTLIKQQGSLVKFDRQTAHVGFPSRWVKKIPEKYPKVEPALEAAFTLVSQHPVKIVLTPAIAPKSPSRPESTLPTQSPRPITTPSTVDPVLPKENLDDHGNEVSSAARSLAKFFRGEVATLEKSMDESWSADSGETQSLGASEDEPPF